MKQIKSLFIKEWQTHRMSFLMPLWFTLGVYVIGLLGWILSLIKGSGMSFQTEFIGVKPAMADIILWGSTTGTTIMLGIVAMITAITLADSTINGGFKRKCEILHLSQPVSLVKIVGTKYLFGIFGSILILGVLSLVNSVVISLFTGYFTSSHIYYGMVGWLQGLISISFSILFLGSLWWFFAGLFRRKSFFMGMLVILGIQAAISILNYTAGLHIPSLTGYLAKLSMISINFSPGHSSLPGLASVDKYIGMQWAEIWDWDSLLKVIYSAVFCVGGFLLYRRREVV
ncbi:MAG TPA: hypothetical protein PL124_06325 [Candidatus Cloacimonadota bacterium]|nr:hypothetical protein [Candidatus Cloacimonadota bacterium]HPS39011.1 hypothetical protein [Candidatus Cloacimonadota bacterium]